MSIGNEIKIEISEQYNFNKDSLERINMNQWVKNQWPIVYFIQNESLKLAYIGESTNAISRLKNHLSNPERKKLNKVSIIGSEKFNKSATLDIESNLIQYLTAEGGFQLQNANFGLVNHNYYQKDQYKDLFKEIWNKLIERKIVLKSLTEIENTEIFKYSPYKSLNEDQYNSILEILDGLSKKKTAQIFISGSAGTGKTILATYLIKLLTTNIEQYNENELSEEMLQEIKYIQRFRANNPNPKIGLVIAMTSLRESLKKVFKDIPGLKPSMVINPSDTFKNNEKYDLLIVDEAHRLRKYKNISWRKAFKKNNQKLNLGDEGTELDWIIANSNSQIFFYDPAQTIKPSDVDAEKFAALLNKNDTLRLELKSQMRVKGGSNYISFVDDLLNCNCNSKEHFKQENYDLLFFDSFRDLHSELEKKEKTFGLCRMIAGYSWPWLSDPKKNPLPTPDTTDIEIEGLKFKWNSTDKGWVNSKNAFQEVGCIHTTQGYDLNYAAVIFGKEIDYNKEKNTIEINSNEYYDKNGKNGISDPNQLKQYIINIYKTLLYRGIRGAYVYAFNKGLREYLKQHIPSFRSDGSLWKIIPPDEAIPFKNSIPLFDLRIAAGNFSELQNQTETKWVRPPDDEQIKKEQFICQIYGESMNKKIPNKSYCLFETYTGGSRNGEITLVQSTNINDAEFGSGYTIKQYISAKAITEEGWEHELITLRPLSNDPKYKDIVLRADEETDLKVIGVFKKVLPFDETE